MDLNEIKEYKTQDNMNMVDTRNIMLIEKINNIKNPIFINY
jgi:hypothetical protein